MKTGDFTKTFLFSLLFLLSCSVVIVLGEPIQSMSKIYINPYYRSSMVSGTNYTYTVSVNPPDGISSVVNAMISFSVYITPTVNYDLWVNSQRCNPATFTISTTYAGAGLGSLSYDCSDVINKAGTYTIKIKGDKNSGSSYAWLDLTYMNKPKGKTSIFGTEYVTGEKGTLFVQLNDNQGLPINNGRCYADIFYPNLPNSTHPQWLNNVAMSYLVGSDGLYYYDLVTPSITGVYMVSATCSYSHQLFWAYEPSGVQYPSQNVTVGTCSGNPLNVVSKDDYRYAQCQSVLMPKYNITRTLASAKHLLNGSVTGSDNSFIASSNITLGLKDNSNTTQYTVYASNQWLQIIPSVSSTYKFEEGSGTVVNDSSKFKNHGKIYGAEYQSSKGTNNTGTYSLFFNSTALANVTSNPQNSFDYPKAFTIGCWVNATKSSAATRGIMSKGYVSASNENYNMYFDGALNKTWFGVGNVTNNVAIGTSTNSVIQGRWTHMVVTANDTRMCIYIDGVMKTCSSVTVKWKAVSGALMIGRQSKASNPFLGKIDECSIFNYSVSRTDIKNWYDGGVFKYETQGKAIKTVFQTTNSSFTNFLKILKTSSGTQTFRIYSYINTTHPSNNYVAAALVKGWNTVNVSKLVTVNNYALGFRFFSNETKTNISEVAFVAEKRDSPDFMQSVIYSYNVSSFDLTNVTNIDLLFLGESTGSKSMSFYVYNYTGSVWRLLPNSVLFHSTALSSPTGVDEGVSNSLPIKDIFGSKKIIKIKQFENDFSSTTTSYTNLLNLNIVTALGTVTEIKGGGEIHVSFNAFSALNQSLASIKNVLVAMNTSVTGKLNVLIDYAVIGNLSLNQLVLLAKQTNITTNNISNYLSTTIYPSIITNQNYLRNILSNQSLTLQQLNYLSSNVSLNQQKINLIISLIGALNSTIISGNTYVSQQLNTMNTTLNANNVLLNYIKNEVNNTIEPSLVNIQTSINVLQANVTEIVENTDTLLAGQQNVLSNLSYLQYLLYNINSSIAYDFSVANSKLDEINTEVGNIESKLDCNWTVNVVCDKLDTMSLTLLNISTEVGYTQYYLQYVVEPQLVDMSTTISQINFTVNGMNYYIINTIEPEIAGIYPILQNIVDNQTVILSELYDINYSVSQVQSDIDLAYVLLLFMNYTQHINFLNLSQSLQFQNNKLDVITQITNLTLYYVQNIRSNVSVISNQLYSINTNLSSLFSLVNAMNQSLSLQITSSQNTIISEIQSVNSSIHSSIYVLGNNISTHLYSMTSEIENYMSSINQSLTYNQWLNTQTVLNTLSLVNQSLSNALFLFQGDVQNNFVQINNTLNNVLYIVSGLNNSIGASLIAYINASFNDIETDLSFLQNITLNMNYTLNTKLDGMTLYLSYMAWELTNIEQKLDCNFTINMVCDKLDEIEAHVDEINQTTWDIYNLLLGFSGGCHWDADYADQSLCNTSDEKLSLKTYHETNGCGSNSGLPVDNGTIVTLPCNYCSSDIQLLHGSCVHNQQNYYYVDNNYGSCCNITGIASDCNITNPVYANYTDVCSRNIFCDYNQNPFLKTSIPFIQSDVVNFVCYVNFTSPYSCVAELYKDSVLLQSNPEVRNIPMFGTVSTFKSNTPIIRGWYRKGTMLPDEKFTVRMRCQEEINATI